MRKIVFAAAILAAAAATHAADWQRVAPGTSNRLLYDRESLVRSGETVQVWRNVVTDKPFNVRAIDGNAWGAISMVEYNCRMRTLRERVTKWFLEPEGRLPLEAPAEDRIEYVEPDSIGERLMKLVCTSTARQ